MPADASAAPAPWLALCGQPEPVALAFEQLEGFLRVKRSDLYAAEPADAARRHVSEIVRVGELSRRVVDTRSTLAALDAVAGASGSTKEQ